MRLEIQGLSQKEKRIMKRVAKIVAVWVIAIILIQIGILHGRRIERECWENALKEVSKEYQTLDTLERIIIAESSGKHKGIWGQDGEFGICQFKKQTFFFLADKAGLPNPDWKDQSQQVALLNWSIRNGFANHWSTFEKMKGEENVD